MPKAELLIGSFAAADLTDKPSCSTTTTTKTGLGQPLSGFFLWGRPISFQNTHTAALGRAAPQKKTRPLLLRRPLSYERGTPGACRRVCLFVNAAGRILFLSLSFFLGGGVKLID
jgi:hypothetical protein